MAAKIKKDEIKEIMPPVQVRSQELPYNELNWDLFEIFCRRLIESQATIEETQTYGVKGDQQFGIDIYAINNAGDYISYQCKNVQKFFPQNVKDAIALFENSVWGRRSKEIVLCSSISLAGQKVQEMIVSERTRLKKKGIRLKIWDSGKLNIMMKSQPQLVYDVFGPSWFNIFIGEERLGEVVKPNKLPEKIFIKAPYPYLSRTVSRQGEEIFSFFGKDKKTLLEVLGEDDKIALLAWGQDGKSTEMKFLESELSKAESPYYPFFYRMKKHGGSDIDLLIPGFDAVPENLRVVLLDGLDEVENDHLSDSIGKIMDFVSRYQKIKIIVSCRTNFYTTSPEDPGFNTLIGFKSYKLNELEPDVVNGFIEEKLGNRMVSFLDAAAGQHITEHLRKAYYLPRLVAEFERSGNVFSGKAELFHQEISDLIATDVRLLGRPNREKDEKRILYLVKKVSFVMRSIGKITITEGEMDEIVSDRDDRFLLKKAGTLIHLSDDEKKWQFISIAVMEYLSALVLSTKRIRQIRKAVVSGFDNKKVAKRWTNVMLFLTSILKNDPVKKQVLVSWLARDNKELLVSLHVQDVDEVFRRDIFVSLFESYEKQERRFSHDTYNPVELARFCESVQVFEYLLGKLESGNGRFVRTNALEIIANFPLSRYPQFKERFTAALSKILYNEVFKADHYYAIVAYTQQNKLSQQEFDRFFVHFRNVGETWTRYALFRAIHMQQQQEHCLGYVLRESLKLVKKDKNDRSSRSKETRLSNEYIELARCLTTLASAEGIVEVLDFLRSENRLNMFFYDTYFAKAVKYIFRKSLEYTNNAALVDAMSTLFLANYSYVLHHDFAPDVVRFLRDANAVEGIFIRLYAELPLGYGGVINCLTSISSEKEIDFLKLEDQAGRLSDETRSSFTYFFNSNNAKLLPYYKLTLGIADQPALPVRDFAAEKVLRTQRTLAALFSKEVFMQEISLIFNLMGTDKIAYDDIFKDGNMYYDEKFLGVSRDYLDLSAQGLVELADTLQKIEQNWNLGFIERIYHWMVQEQNKDVVLNEVQRKALILWCDKKVKQIDFRTAISEDTYNSWTLSTHALWLSFFLRKLDLKGYQKSLYLDMLSFARHEDSVVTIFDFVESRCSLDTVTERVLENLVSGISYPGVLQGHLDFIQRFNITQAAPLLLEYMTDGHNANKSEVLNLYLKLNGDVVPLEKVLCAVDGYFRDFLINTLIKIECPFLKKKLIDLYSLQEDLDEKLHFARFLIPLQYLPALDFYCDAVYAKGIVPDNSSPVNPLYQLRTPRATLRLVRLALFSGDKHVKFDKMSDLLTISITALKGLALYGNNHRWVDLQLRAYLKWMKFCQLFSSKKLDRDLIYNIEENWRMINRTNAGEREGSLDLAGAIKLYRVFE